MQSLDSSTNAGCDLVLQLDEHRDAKARAVRALADRQQWPRLTGGCLQCLLLCHGPDKKWL